jgi:hypothetical protein
MLAALSEEAPMDTTKLEFVTLKKAAKINGAIHQPSEGKIAVTIEDAARLRSEGVLASEADELDGHTIAELTEIAADERVSLDGLSLKADIIAAIRTRRGAA